MPIISVSKVAARPFDPSALPTDELTLFTLCRDISEAPDARADSTMHLIQVAFRETEYERAIRILRAHLYENGLAGHERCSIDRTRFRALRKLRRVTLQQLANALGVTAAAVSSLEGRNGRLRFERLLLAAAVLEVRPADFMSTGSLRHGVSGVTHQ